MTLLDTDVAVDILLYKLNAGVVDLIRAEPIRDRLIRARPNIEET
jgi:hypothetical protein